MPKRKRVTRNDLSLLVGEVVKVRWEDCSGIDEGSVKEADRPLYFDNYGLVVKESEKSIVLCSMAPSDGKDEQFRLLTRIPRRSVDSVTILEEASI